MNEIFYEEEGCPREVEDCGGDEEYTFEEYINDEYSPMHMEGYEFKPIEVLKLMITEEQFHKLKRDYIRDNY